MSLVSKLPEFRLEAFFSKWEFTARFNLGASDAQTMTISELLAMASEEERAAFSDLPLGYTPTWGGDELRSAISASYTTLCPDDILVFAGAEEALYWAMQLLVAPTEHVIITVPNYQAMETLPLQAGVQVSGVLLDPENGWRLDLDAVRAQWRPNTRLVAVNFPNNPTGAVPDHETWADLLALCEERGARLLSDEVYRGVELDERRTLPQAADMSRSAVSLNVMSKSFGLPGLRVGWIATRDHAVLEQLERHKHYTSMCNSGPSESLATIAMRNADVLHERTRARIVNNLPLFDTFFGRHEDLFEWEHPNGGCVAFPKYLGSDGVDAMCARLVENAGVLLLPASLFRSDLETVPTNRFRLGVGRADPEPALAEFEKFLRKG